jgi:hypothetical protein
MTREQHDTVFKQLSRTAANTIESGGKLPRRYARRPKVAGEISPEELNTIWEEVIAQPWAAKSLMTPSEEENYRDWLHATGRG